MCVLDDAQQRVPWWRRWVNLTGPGLVSVAEVLEAGRTGPGVEPHGVSGAVVELGGGGGQQGHGAPLVGVDPTLRRVARAHERGVRLEVGAADQGLADAAVGQQVERVRHPHDLSLIHISEPTRRTPISYA